MKNYALPNEFYMQLAINEAWKYQFHTYPNPAVGCCVLDKFGQILAIDAHSFAGGFHAERKCIAQILAKFGKDALKDSTFFITLEPCSKVGKTPACSKALIDFGVKNLFIGSYDESQNSLQELKNAGIKIHTGICKKECNLLLAPFLAWQKKEPFIVFKMANSLDANNIGKISNDALRTYFHTIRSNLDLLVCSGATIRKDNPRLDARFAKFHSERFSNLPQDLQDNFQPKIKIPKLLICTKEKMSNLNCQIDGREILYRESFCKLREFCKENGYLNVMIEGGFTALKACKNEIDWLFLQRSNSGSFAEYSNSQKILSSLKLEPIYQNSSDLFEKNQDAQMFGFYKIQD